MKIMFILLIVFLIGCDDETSNKKKVDPAVIPILCELDNHKAYLACEIKDRDFTKQSLRRAIFRNSILENVDFTGVNLIKSDFTNAEIINSKFNNAILTGASFENTDISGSEFNNVELQGSKFDQSILKDTTFKGSTLDKSSFNNINLENVIFDETKLNNITFLSENTDGLNIRNVSFKKAVFKNTRFNGNNFNGADFTNTNLSGLTIENANITNFNFLGSEFQNISIISSKFLDPAIDFYNIKNNEILNSRFRFVEFNGTVVFKILKDSSFYSNIFRNNVTFRSDDSGNSQIQHTRFNESEFKGNFELKHSRSVDLQFHAVSFEKNNDFTGSTFEEHLERGTSFFKSAKFKVSSPILTDVRFVKNSEGTVNNVKELFNGVSKLNNFNFDFNTNWIKLGGVLFTGTLRSSDSEILFQGNVGYVVQGFSDDNIRFGNSENVLNIDGFLTEVTLVNTDYKYKGLNVLKNTTTFNMDNITGTPANVRKIEYIFGP